jgi:hypothetical protein
MGDVEKGIRGWQSSLYHDEREGGRFIVSRVNGIVMSIAGMSESAVTKINTFKRHKHQYELPTHNPYINIKTHPYIGINTHINKLEGSEVSDVLVQFQECLKL